MKAKIIKFENGAIVANLPTMYPSNGFFEIDGESRIDSGSVSGKIVLKKLPKTIKYRYKKEIIDCYKNSDGNTISPEDFEKKKNSLLEKELDEDGDFKNLDDEYRYKKFIKEWFLVYKEVEKEENVEFSVFECGSVPNEYKDHIVSKYHLPDYGFKQHYFDLRINSSIIINKIAQKYGFIQQKYGIFSHNTKGKNFSIGDREDGWESLKINDNYAFYEGNIRKRYILNVDSITLEDAKQRVDDFEKLIEDAFRKENNKIENKNLDFKFIVETLESIKRGLEKVEPKQKTVDDYRRAISKLRNLIEEINK